MVTPVSRQYAATPTWRWWIAALLFLATVLNYLDRQVLSVTAPVLRRAFNMSATEYSQLVFAFLLAYTLGQSLAGRLMDRIGPKSGLTLAMAWWSTAGVLHAAAGSLAQLSAFRFLLGIGESANWPGAVKTVEQWFLPQERALAVGLFNSGSAIGAVVAPPLISWITLRYSWRFAFLLTGTFGFLWMIPWLLVNRRPAPPTLKRTAIATGHWRVLLRDRRICGLMLARYFCDPVWWFYVFWLPDYLSRARGFDLAMIGLSAWVPFLTADLGNIMGGYASGYLIQRGFHVTAARKSVMVCGAAVMTVGVFTARIPSATGAIALMSTVTFAYSCWAVNVLTLPADIFDSRDVGLATGLAGTAAGIGGMLNTLAVGWIVDHSSYAHVFAITAVLPLAGCAALLILVREPHQHQRSKT